MTRRSALTRPARYASSSSLTGENPDGIVGERQHHDDDQQEEPDVAEPGPQLARQWLSAHRFGDEEHQLAAVQNRNGQQIQDGQVDRKERHEGEEPVETEACDLPRDLADRNDAPDLAERGLVEHQSLQEPEHHHAPAPRLLKAGDDGAANRLAHVDRGWIGRSADGAVYVRSRRWARGGPRLRTAAWSAPPECG